MVFTEKPYAKITATIDGTADPINIDGVTTDDTITPEEAKAQIDKVLGVVGKAVKTVGMKRIRIEEATANG